MAKRNRPTKADFEREARLFRANYELAEKELGRLIAQDTHTFMQRIEERGNSGPN